MCMRKGVLMVVMHHGPGHVWMMLYGHTTVRVREQWVTWRCWRLYMIGGPEDAMVCGTRPRRLVVYLGWVLRELLRNSWGLLRVEHGIGSEACYAGYCRDVAASGCRWEEGEP